VRPRELLWTVAFLLFDRGADEGRTGALLAAVVVVLGIVAVVALALPVLRGWAQC
jgi:hypothetical protein